ncbi:alkaline phosphatase family protein [Marinobacter zhejiangensis]|uniref:Type I phosphodiesterase / nucleotide pyrophosphatase n=1 Tax=Marinobacter zhejiangensis TaxID=488535 RepID=A0A1I4QA04_9GAMM|nr:alkaline phosphatase family protein [Marinobacter zhejiangensis]SFM36515.1 Type I phosphodiesterase / nucleotide pyrophosphatase [Marinobacter zhejiangensis]
MTFTLEQRPRRNAWLATLAAALITLSGCGGGSGASQDTTKPTDPGGDNVTPEVTPDPTPEPITKALVIGIDGLMYEYIDDIDTPDLNEPVTPNFDRLTLTKAHVGGYLNTTTYQVSISGPAWTSILTGTWTDRHGVTGNDGAASQVYGIFYLLDQLDPTMKTGSFAAWTDINSGHMRKDMAYVDRRVDGSSRAEGQLVDDFITDQVISELEDDASPLRFIFAHLDRPDATGHDCGWCAATEQAVADTDARVGRILDAVAHRERTLNEEWLVIMVSDHGHREAGGHDRNTVIERTSVIGVNKPALFNEFLSTPASPLMLSNDPEQNALMGYPGITTVVPTVMTYLGYPPQLGSAFDSPSLIGDLGAYKLYNTIDQSRRDQATVTLNWQISGNATQQYIYRGDTLIAELGAMDSQYQDSVTLAELGEGTHQINYTVVSDVGAPVTSLAEVKLAECGLFCFPL